MLLVKQGNCGIISFISRKQGGRTLTYVLADIHGRMDRFQEVLDKIRFTEDDTMYILGDVVDRNPDGIEILERIMQTGNMHMLLGNHEHMMLHAIKTPQASMNGRRTYIDLWYYNGGQITHDAFKRLSDGRKEAMLAFIEGLPLNIPVACGGKNYLLVHGAPASMYIPDSSGYADETTFAVWHRLDPFEERHDPEVTVICGHTPTVHFNDVSPMEVFRRENILCIDCGCAYGAPRGGRLACLCLETGAIVYSER